MRLPLGAAGNTWTLVRAETPVTVAVTGAFAVNNMAMVLRLAELGLGIAAIHEFLAAGAVAQGRLVRVLPDWAFRTTPVSAFTATRLLPAKTRVFVEFLAAALRTDLTFPATGD